MSAPLTSPEAKARASLPPPRSHNARAELISPRKPTVLTLARLFAVAAWRAIAPRSAESEVWTRRSISYQPRRFMIAEVIALAVSIALALAWKLRWAEIRETSS